MNARVRFPLGLRGLSRSELRACISECIFDPMDTLIATRYFVDGWAQIDIAAELGCVRSTVGNHVKYILPEVEQTAARMGIAKS